MGREAPSSGLSSGETGAVTNSFQPGVLVHMAGPAGTSLDLLADAVTIHRLT